MSLCEKTRAAAKRYKPTKMYIYQCFTRFNFHGNITEWDWMIRIQFAGAGVKLAGKGLMCNQEFVDDDYYLDSVCHIETADFMIDIGETAAELTVEIFDENTNQGTDSIRIVPDRVIMPTTTNTHP